MFPLQVNKRIVHTEILRKSMNNLRPLFFSNNE